jgi:hypothetical protein
MKTRIAPHSKHYRCPRIGRSSFRWYRIPSRSARLHFGWHAATPPHQSGMRDNPNAAERIITHIPHLPHRPTPEYSPLHARDQSGRIHFRCAFRASTCSTYIRAAMITIVMGSTIAIAYHPRKISGTRIRVTGHYRGSRDDSRSRHPQQLSWAVVFFRLSSVLCNIRGS